MRRREVNLLFLTILPILPYKIFTKYWRLNLVFMPNSVIRKNFRVFCQYYDDDTADDTTLYCKCDQASDLWQQLEFVYELESDLRD